MNNQKTAGLTYCAYNELRPTACAVSLPHMQESCGKENLITKGNRFVSSCRLGRVLLLSRWLVFTYSTC